VGDDLTPGQSRRKTMNATITSTGTYGGTYETHIDVQTFDDGEVMVSQGMDYYLPLAEWRDRTASVLRFLRSYYPRNSRKRLDAIATIRTIVDKVNAATTTEGGK